MRGCSLWNCILLPLNNGKTKRMSVFCKVKTSLHFLLWFSLLSSCWQKLLDVPNAFFCLCLTLNPVKGLTKLREWIICWYSTGLYSSLVENIQAWSGSGNYYFTSYLQHHVVFLPAHHILSLSSLAPQRILGIHTHNKKTLKTHLFSPLMQ